jgi:GMP synthase (glutamine-hydrolysing)
MQRLLDVRKPVLGICLGAQLLAKAAAAQVGPASEPEIGWFPVELTSDAAEDPVLGGLPSRFEAFQWHYYAHDLPAGAVELARNEICTQAFRLGESAWGVQFHPEVTLAQVESWANEDEPVPDDLLDETRERIGAWNELGKSLCDAFVEVAERTGQNSVDADSVKAGA